MKAFTLIVFIMISVGGVLGLLWYGRSVVPSIAFAEGQVLAGPERTINRLSPEKFHSCAGQEREAATAHPSDPVWEVSASTLEAAIDVLDLAKVDPTDPMRATAGRLADATKLMQRLEAAKKGWDDATHGHNALASARDRGKGLVKHLNTVVALWLAYAEASRFESLDLDHNTWREQASGDHHATPFEPDVVKDAMERFVDLGGWTSPLAERNVSWAKAVGAVRTRDVQTLQLLRAQRPPQLHARLALEVNRALRKALPTPLDKAGVRAQIRLAEEVATAGDSPLDRRLHDVWSPRIPFLYALEAHLIKHQATLEVWSGSAFTYSEADLSESESKAIKSIADSQSSIAEACKDEESIGRGGISPVTEAEAAVKRLSKAWKDAHDTAPPDLQPLVALRWNPWSKLEQATTWGAYNKLITDSVAEPVRLTAHRLRRRHLSLEVFNRDLPVLERQAAELTVRMPALSDENEWVTALRHAFEFRNAVLSAATNIDAVALVAPLSDTVQRHFIDNVDITKAIEQATERVSRCGALVNAEKRLAEILESGTDAPDSHARLVNAANEISDAIKILRASEPKFDAYRLSLIDDLLTGRMITLQDDALVVQERLEREDRVNLERRGATNARVVLDRVLFAWRWYESARQPWRERGSALACPPNVSRILALWKVRAPEHVVVLFTQQVAALKAYRHRDAELLATGVDLSVAIAPADHAVWSQDFAENWRVESIKLLKDEKWLPDLKSSAEGLEHEQRAYWDAAKASASWDFATAVDKFKALIAWQANHPGDRSARGAVLARQGLAYAEQLATPHDYWIKKDKVFPADRHTDKNPKLGKALLYAGRSYDLKDLIELFSPGNDQIWVKFKWDLWFQWKAGDKIALQIWKSGKESDANHVVGDKKTEYWHYYNDLDQFARGIGHTVKDLGFHFTWRPQVYVEEFPADAKVSVRKIEEVFDKGEKAVQRNVLGL